MVYQQKENGSIQMLPYDKFMQYGVKSLSDEELLAIILRTGTQGEDALTLAVRVLSLCKSKGILGLHHLTMDELMSVRGIGEVKAVKLKTIAELSLRMAQATCESDVSFRAPETVARAYMERMRHYEKEHCIAVYLDTKDMRIADEELSVGDVSSSILSAREIFKGALRHDASSVILLHNHPSGSARPSSEDLVLTRQICEAAKLMGIALLDHIIIGDNTYTSLKEEGVI